MFNTNIMNTIAKHTRQLTMYHMLQAYPRLIGDVIVDKQVFVMQQNAEDIHLKCANISLKFGTADVDIIETCIKTCRRIFASSASISKIHLSDTTSKRINLSF
jgi:hypothetical protein